MYFIVPIIHRPLLTSLQLYSYRKLPLPVKNIRFTCAKINPLTSGRLQLLKNQESARYSSISIKKNLCLQNGNSSQYTSDDSQLTRSPVSALTTGVRCLASSTPGRLVTRPGRCPHPSCPAVCFGVTGTFLVFDKPDILRGQCLSLRTHVIPANE